MAARKLRFDAFELDLSSEELFRNGERVKLAPQPFKVLAALASRPGAVVSRGELQRSVWNDGVHVDFEGSLHSCIKQIRAALGDDRAAPRFIETVPRRGYRFLPPVADRRPVPRAVWMGFAAVVVLLATFLMRFQAPVGAVSEAEDLVLRGRYLLENGNRDALDRAAGYFEASARLDPRFAAAHVGLGEVSLRRAMETGRRDLYAEAETSSRRALELAPSADAEFVLALARWYGAWDWDEAGDAFRRAIEESPDFARAHHWYAYYLTGLGRHDEAIVAIERAHHLDPLSAEILSDVGWFYYFAGRYDEAIEASLRTLELEPEFRLARECLLESRLARGDDVEGVGEDFWRSRLERASRDPYTAAVAAVRLGRSDDALRLLHEAVERKSLWVPVLAVDPRLASMRSSRKLTDLARVAGLR